MTVTNSTLSGNIASLGGGIVNYWTATLRNSIITNSTGGNCLGSGTSSSNSLADDASCYATVATATELKLGTLGDYGGPTQTIPLLAGSVAIDGTGSNCPATDQRGMTRTSTCDIGAYERGAAATLTTTGGTPQTAAINTAFAAPLTAKVVDSLGTALDGVSVTFTGPGSGAGITASGSVDTDASGIASYPVTANGTAGPYTVTATVDALSADFNLTNIFSYNLTVLVTGPGTVTSVPAGINCGADCSNTYDDNTKVTLTATPDAKARFKGWSGACSGTQATCDVTVDQTIFVGAGFDSGFPWLILMPGLSSPNKVLK